jgi:hypothetical protein
MGFETRKKVKTHKWKNKTIQSIKKIFINARLDSKWLSCGSLHFWPATWLPSVSTAPNLLFFDVCSSTCVRKSRPISRSRTQPKIWLIWGKSKSCIWILWSSNWRPLCPKTPKRTATRKRWHRSQPAANGSSNMQWYDR